MRCRYFAEFRGARAGLVVLAMVVGAALVAACAPQADRPDVDSSGPNETDDLDAIRALMQKVNQADLSGDVEGLLACYTDDIVSMPPDLPALVGKDALRAYYEEAFSQLSIEALEMTPEETHVAGDWAFSRGKFEQTVVPTGGDPFEVVGKYLFVFHREADGSWKAARLIGNLDGPSPGM